MEIDNNSTHDHSSISSLSFVDDPNDLDCVDDISEHSSIELSEDEDKFFRNVEENKIIDKLSKKHPLLSAWKSSIINHLWWSASHCDENAEKLEEIFLGVLKHVKNIHKRKGGKHLLTRKAFLDDLRHLRVFLHSGLIEAYHRLRFCYTPKLHHSSLKRYVMLSKLAVLDHNHNVGRMILGAAEVYSKRAHNWVIKNKNEPKSHQWKDEIM
ncbi:hypothetical protein B566_EDAN015984 [Ephemera danica]|nr:hypothetical protein B566_EDAN015984 [Ephemera danica]